MCSISGLSAKKHRSTDTNSRPNSPDFQLRSDDPVTKELWDKGHRSRDLWKSVIYDGSIS
ncbi:hypothetical protein AG1IA_06724 [Rhizoctonia solani AG-1 IA]|uniref:Uncharacterized protein n=1 Tax=Thanatephorus cucumeris (strain AG1-IA) TaxID=983506 RepID=L8WMR8_THACA|nr:hypothetical protein AG1IA_06724 [Rhizoctonia solani AG-1 IA]